MVKSIAISTRMTCQPPSSLDFGRSYPLLLTHFTDDTILKNMDDSKIAGVVYVDLSKAFDTIDHTLLLEKLKSFA